MPFSAQTCLTYTGSTPLGGTINVYTDLDYSTPLSSVTLSQITSPNCPFTFILPDGATIIRLLDTLTFCYADIPVSSNNLCSICDLNFTSLVSDSIGKISAGLLTGSCDPSITDYVINWYGPNSTTTLAFTSGIGTLFSGYNYTHPLTGITSIPVLEGTYVPEIDKVKLNGVVFSSTGGSGNVLAELDCFSAITVSGYNCSNGTEAPGSDYTHRIQFSGNSGAGVVPIPLLSSFNLTGTTDYFAFKFKGESISDRLEILYSGQNYSQLLSLEDIEVGSNIFPTNTNFNTFPKSASTSVYISKVLCLTGLSQTSLDELILRVTPSNNPQTNWDFYFTCLSSFDCSPGCLTGNPSPYLIITSGISTIAQTCGRTQINLPISGCSDAQSLDLYKYYTNGQLGSIPSNGSYNYSFLLNTGLTQCGTFGTGPLFPTCANSGNQIYFSKYINGGVGEIKITGNNLSDFNSYINSYNTVTGYTLSAPTPYNSNPTSVGYYQYLSLNVPNTTGSQSCGDGTSPINFSLHYSSVVTTAQTGSDWEITFTMPTISVGTAFTACEALCDFTLSSIVNTVNSSSTGTSTNYTATTTVGSRYTSPFNVLWYMNYQTSVLSSTTLSSFFFENDYLSKTIISSGSPLTVIPSLTAQTCDLSEYMHYVDNGNADYWQRYLFYYNVQLINPTLNSSDFEVLVSPLDSLGRYTGYPGAVSYPITALTYSAGVITYSSSTYCI